MSRTRNNSQNIVAAAKIGQESSKMDRQNLLANHYQLAVERHLYYRDGLKNLIGAQMNAAIINYLWRYVFSILQLSFQSDFPNSCLRRDAVYITQSRTRDCNQDDRGPLKARVCIDTPGFQDKVFYLQRYAQTVVDRSS